LSRCILSSKFSSYTSTSLNPAATSLRPELISADTQTCILFNGNRNEMALVYEEASMKLY
jgi:hypothetical protein